MTKGDMRLLCDDGFVTLDEYFLDVLAAEPEDGHDAGVGQVHRVS